MTPQEHIDQAEQILARVAANLGEGVPGDVVPDVLVAIGHALVALAVEGGVPHSTPVVAGS